VAADCQQCWRWPHWPPIHHQSHWQVRRQGLAPLRTSEADRARSGGSGLTRFKTTVPPPQRLQQLSMSSTLHRHGRHIQVDVRNHHSSGEPSSARPIAILSTSAADAFQRTTTFQAGSLSAGSRRHGAACPIRLWNSACNLKSLMRLMRRSQLTLGRCQ
jgi:hypothetical protein